MLVAVALLVATPLNYTAQLAAAQPGDTVRFVGNFPRVTVNTKKAAPVTLDMTGATVNWLYINQASNWTINSGLYDGAANVAIQVTSSDHIALKQPTVTNFRTAAVSIGGSTYIDIEGISCAHSGGDGVDIVSSQHITINGLQAHDLNYTADLHSDLVQMWSVTGSAPTDDVRITNVIASGSMQGIDSFGNGSGLTVSNIDVENVVIATDKTWGVNLTNCQGTCTGKNITLYTLASLPKGFQPPSIVITGPNVVLSGNTPGVAP